MFLTAELLVHFQRCHRRAYLDVYGNPGQRDRPSDYLRKLMQDSVKHRRDVIGRQRSLNPNYSEGDWESGAKATLTLMKEGAERIHYGVMLVPDASGVTLVSRPDLLVKQPGKSDFGDWIYNPINVKLGKRLKVEYQLSAAFDAWVLATVQGAWAETVSLVLRDKGACAVDLWKFLPQMQETLDDCIQMLRSPEDPPDVFIARNRCSLCHWYSHCHEVAEAQQHLSLLPGVTPSRYTYLQGMHLTTVESLAKTDPRDLELLPGFGREASRKLVHQAHATLKNEAVALVSDRDYPPFNVGTEIPSRPVELYFDIEAEPDMNLAYLLGVLVVDHQSQTETFHSLLAEEARDEEQVWQKFLQLVDRYPDAPIFHFCPYEASTIRRLGELYGTPLAQIQPLLARFVDLHERVTRIVTLPVENYALKPIARWMGFNWRDSNATGAQTVYWYARWLDTGDRSCLEAIVRYNEDDCQAMYAIKDWLIKFFQAPADSQAS